MSQYPERLPNTLEAFPLEVRLMLTNKLFDQQLKLRGGIHKLIEAMYRGEHRGEHPDVMTVSYGAPAHSVWPLMLEDTTAFLTKRALEREAKRQQEIQFPPAETHA